MWVGAAKGVGGGGGGGGEGRGGGGGGGGMRVTGLLQGFWIFCKL